MTRTTLSAIILAVLVTPASAAIRCNDDFQVVQGNEISTPYCGDNYLAKVARKYGIRVSNAEIRNNPNRKGEVCRMIGHDIRVKDACAGYSSDRGRGR
ncbi:MAG: hypothetical protein Q7T86_00955 [Hyphomicrobiaceae bacterium]|nr:hypothetical protein [Hyphomicrobiaceae bacterium]